MTSRRWGTIFPGNSTKELTDVLRKSLTDRMTEASAVESLRLLHGIRAELDAELAVSKRIPEEIGKLIEAMSLLTTDHELKAITVKYAELIAEFFTARSSVSTACTLARSFYEELIQTAFMHAVMHLESEGRKNPATPWAVLVSGELGRDESVLGKNSSIFFIYKETPTVANDYFPELALRFMEIIELCLPNFSRNMNSPPSFWFCSDVDWFATVTATLHGEKSDSRQINDGASFALMVETIADMRPVCGDQDFGRNVITFGRKQLADSLRSEHFSHYAKEIVEMPVALGIFGRIKTLRSGKNRGRFELKEFALTPLTAATRILAIACGVVESSFTERIQAIIAAGSIGVALADRLLIAYEDFMREMIRLELADQQGTNQFFFNPDSLNEESKERFKAGLDDVTALQRHVYQQLVEVDIT